MTDQETKQVHSLSIPLSAGMTNPIQSYPNIIGNAEDNNAGLSVLSNEAKGEEDAKAAMQARSRR